MNRKTLITRAIIVAFAVLALIEGWSLATAPRPKPLPAAATNATSP